MSRAETGDGQASSAGTIWQIQSRCHGRYPNDAPILEAEFRSHFQADRLLTGEPNGRIIIVRLNIELADELFLHIKKLEPITHLPQLPTKMGVSVERYIGEMALNSHLALLSKREVSVSNPIQHPLRRASGIRKR